MMQWRLVNFVKNCCNSGRISIGQTIDIHRYASVKSQNTTVKLHFKTSFFMIKLPQKPVLPIDPIFQVIVGGHAAPRRSLGKRPEGLGRTERGHAKRSLGQNLGR